MRTLFLSDIILHLDEQEKQTVYGQLTLPVDSLNPQKKYPVILGVAGSLGWREHHRDYLKMYRDLGFATFELNSFKSRGITSTVGSQDQVTIAGIILDAYRALEALSKHPNVKPKSGHYRLVSEDEFFWLDAREKRHHQRSCICGHLAMYPPCLSILKTSTLPPPPCTFKSRPITDPGTTLPKSSRKLAEKSTIDITVYPDAHHG